MYKDSKFGTFLNIYFIMFLVFVKRRMDDGGCDSSILILLQFYLRDLKQRWRKTTVTVSANTKARRNAINAGVLYLSWNFNYVLKTEKCDLKFMFYS